MTLHAQPSCAPPAHVVNGEHLLLGGIPDAGIPPAPFYKRRYTWDGDTVVGCTIGCQFCYYRWIDTTAATIGAGRAALRAVDPDPATWLAHSALFDPDNDLVMLCARSDGSMDGAGITAFLQRFTAPTTVMVLQRGVAREPMISAWGADARVVFCTTLTPDGDRLGWTPIDPLRQIAGLARMQRAGWTVRRISVMLGPITAANVTAALTLMERLADLGLPFLTYRGASVGSFGVTPDRDHLRRIGFLTGQPQHAPPGHDYYAMKNVLEPAVEERIRAHGARLGLRLYRTTGALYRDEFGVRIAYNRNNRWRRALGSWPRLTLTDLMALQETLRAWGYPPEGVQETEEGYVVTLPPGLAATEDVAMSIGARFGTSVIFSAHRIAPTLDDLRHYARFGLMPVPARMLDIAAQRSGAVRSAGRALG